MSAPSGRLRSGLVLLVALLVVGALSIVEPRGEDMIWHEATAPGTADAGDFRVSLESPVEDAIIVDWVSRGARRHESEHKIALVRVRYDFVRHDARITDAHLVSTDGYRYKSLYEYELTHVTLEPGFSSRSTVVFEVPEDKLIGADLEFCRTAIVRQREHCARITGAITQDTPRHDGAGVTLERSLLSYEVSGP